jgi:hypothetical protein
MPPADRASCGGRSSSWTSPGTQIPQVSRRCCRLDAHRPDDTVAWCAGLSGENFRRRSEKESALKSPLRPRLRGGGGRTCAGRVRCRAFCAHIPSRGGHHLPLLRNGPHPLPRRRPIEFTQQPHPEEPAQRASRRVGYTHTHTAPVAYLRAEVTPPDRDGAARLLRVRSWVEAASARESSDGDV